MAMPPPASTSGGKHHPVPTKSPALPVMCVPPPNPSLFVLSAAVSPAGLVELDRRALDAHHALALDVDRGLRLERQARAAVDRHRAARPGLDLHGPGLAALDLQRPDRRLPGPARRR